jgi:SAM-dependent methyltransferase
MGIGIVELNFLDFCDVNLGRVLTVGRQEFHLPKSHQLYGFSEKYLMKLGAFSVTSIDFSNYEGSSLEIDLSKAIKDIPKVKYDTILDFGSLEHISNPIIALENLLNLLAPNGKIIHSCPANGSLGHGFYQFSPEFFQSAYAASGVVDKVDTYLVDRRFPRSIFLVMPVAKGRRANIRFEKSNIYNLVCTTKKSTNEVVKNLNFQQRDYLGRYEKGNALVLQKNVSYLTNIKIKLVDYINLRKSRLNKRNSDLIAIKIDSYVRPQGFEPRTF